MTQREEFEAWWEEFSSAHEDWRFADNDALRWATWQAAHAAQPSQYGSPESHGQTAYKMAKALADHLAVTPVEPNQALSLDLLERLSKTLTRLGYATPEGGMEHFNADLANQLYNLCRAVDSLFDREQPPAPAQAASGAPSESLSGVQRQAFIKGWDHRGMVHELKGSVETDDRMRVLMGVFYPRVDAAPSDTAIAYMTGYSDGREWAQPSQTRELSDDEIDALLPTITLKGLDPKQQVWLTKKDAIAFARAIIAAIKQGGRQ